MTLTPDWNNKIIDSSDSITDIVAFHQALRVLEASPVGMLYPAIHTYRALDIGNGGHFYAVDFLNSWRLRFPMAGNYTITGNITAEIVPVAGVFIQQTKALAFATTSAGAGGGSSSTGLTVTQDALLTALAQIHGLLPGVPLVVGPSQRAAGTLVQSVTENNGVVTVALQ
jgi:hypothetical protein